MATNKQDLRAFVRYDGNGRVIPGGNILNRWIPKVGKWIETTVNICCTHTTTSTTTISLLKIGDRYQGGAISYLFKEGDPGYVNGEQHGLIFGLQDVYWDQYPTGGKIYSNVNLSIGTTSSAIGSGYANSLAIVGQIGHTSSAAYDCMALSTGGYNDWYSPSKDELNTVHLALVAGYDYNISAGDNTFSCYKSSTETNSNHFYCQFLNGGVQTTLMKSSIIPVRAMRTF